MLEFFTLKKIEKTSWKKSALLVFWFYVSFPNTEPLAQINLLGFYYSKTNPGIQKVEITICDCDQQQLW